jgi:CheY-like chemotaxis protein
MEEDQERAMNAGCQGYITKPINTKGFLTTIAQYF